MLVCFNYADCHCHCHNCYLPDILTHFELHINSWIRLIINDSISYICRYLNDDKLIESYIDVGVGCCERTALVTTLGCWSSI